MADVLTLLALVMAIVGGVLLWVALIDGHRLGKLLSRETYPDSYANRQELTDQ